MRQPLCAQGMLMTLVLDAKHTPQGVLGNEVTGIGNATSTSITDQLTRQHRMTLDEAHLILNVKRGDNMEIVLKVSLQLHALLEEEAVNFIHTSTMNICSKPTRQPHHHPKTRL
jgi:hypothetical protein